MVDRPYQLLRHAEDKLTASSTELDLIDTFTTLKRVAFHRKTSLETIYKLRQIPVSDLPNDPLERLAVFHLIRPMILRTLIDIRNSIEHSDGRAPSVDRCKEIAELIWYFLRSTDPLVGVIRDLYLLRPMDSDEAEGYWIEVRTGPSDNWVIEVRGWLPDNFVNLACSEGWCLIEGSLTRAGEHLHPEDGKRPPKDAFIHGRVQGPRERLIQFYRQYFSQV